MSDISNLSDTIIPKSDHLNADMLLVGPITATVTDVRRGDKERPIIISFKGDNGLPFKPCKTMRKVLMFAWGDDGNDWIGRSMVLYHEPEVRYGGVKTGGVRISHLSHIDKDIILSLTATKGRKETITISRMEAPQGSPAKDEVKDARAALNAAARRGMDALREAWGSLPAAVRKSLGAETLEAMKSVAAKASVEAPVADASQTQPDTVSRFNSDICDASSDVTTSTAEPEVEDDDPF